MEVELSIPWLLITLGLICWGIGGSALIRLHEAEKRKRRLDQIRGKDPRP